MDEDKIKIKISEEREKLKLCDGDCNHCPLLLHPNGRMITRILSVLNSKHEDTYLEVGYRCPTCCVDCNIDDFCHDKGCLLDADQNPSPSDKKR